jgi:hypothetical protein
VLCHTLWRNIRHPLRARSIASLRLRYRNAESHIETRHCLSFCLRGPHANTLRLHWVTSFYLQRQRIQATETDVDTWEGDTRGAEVTRDEYNYELTSGLR